MERMRGMQCSPRVSPRRLPRCRAEGRSAVEKRPAREAFWRGVEIPSPLPRHVAICMDGNRRWAVLNGVSLQAAYRKAETVAESMLASCQLLDIDALTLFAFSSENWKRDLGQVTLLMRLFERKIEESWHRWNAQNLRVHFIGDFSKLSPHMLRLIRRIQEETQSNDGLSFTIALSYGGRQDLIRSIQKLACNVQEGSLEPGEITEAALVRCMQTGQAFGEVGEPDLFIRTSGEQRLSNFMLWDMAYTELYFHPVLWPDFCQEDFLQALQNYSKRNRRFGR